MVTWRLLLTGFSLLTLALLISMSYLNKTQGSYWSGDPKVIWSFLVWAMYLGLMLMRWRLEQGGRKFAWGAVAGFAFVLLTFWGTNLLSPIHNP